MRWHRVAAVFGWLLLVAPWVGLATLPGLWSHPLDSRYWVVEKLPDAYGIFWQAIGIAMASLLYFFLILSLRRAAVVSLCTALSVLCGFGSVWFWGESVRVCREAARDQSTGGMVSDPDARDFPQRAAWGWVVVGLGTMTLVVVGRTQLKLARAEIADGQNPSIDARAAMRWSVWSLPASVAIAVIGLRTTMNVTPETWPDMGWAPARCIFWMNGLVLSLGALLIIMLSRRWRRVFHSPWLWVGGVLVLVACVLCVLDARLLSLGARAWESSHGSLLGPEFPAPGEVARHAQILWAFAGMGALMIAITVQVILDEDESAEGVSSRPAPPRAPCSASASRSSSGPRPPAPA